MMAISYLKTNRRARLARDMAGVILISLGAMTAQAQTPTAGWVAPKGVNKVLRTLLPSWQVGDIDSKLSRLCSFGRFNQHIPYKYSGHFQGPNGAALVGGAKGSGLNLFDPTGARKPDHDYWFYRDRSSNCIVYSAKVKPQPVRQ